MTVTTFFKLYKCYKDTFDIEMRLRNANMTYEEAEKKQRQKDDWF